MTRLGPAEVAPIGLGCMNLSHVYHPLPSRSDAVALLERALELGVDHLDTAALYGGGANEELIGSVLGSRRSQVTLASKCGMTMTDGKRVIDGRPATLRATCENALRSLRTDVIDVYYLHRLDPSVPVEESVGELAALVDEGKIRSIGLSEVSADTLRRAHAVHPIAALQQEYSLWTRNPELGTLAACEELGVTLVAFSPLGRGALTDAGVDVASLPAADLRPSMPRFQGDAWSANQSLISSLRALAASAGVTTAQLALAWVLAQSPSVVAIPGTRSIAHLEEDLTPVSVPADVLARAGELVNASTVSGPRYAPAAAADVDTESFPHAG